MADDGRAKRLKSSSEDDIVTPEVAALRGRIADLESAGKKEAAELRGKIAELELAGNKEVAELRGRIAELESENEQLRRIGRGEGNHEVLPVVANTTVDLSRVDSSIVIQISSFLGTSRELLNLGLACKSLGRRQPSSALTLPLVEEVARQEVCSRANAADMDSLPQYLSGTTTWLSILYRFEHLLVFDVLLGQQGIEHRNGDKSTVCGTGEFLCTALSSIYVMKTGSHYAEFEIIDGTRGSPYIGIVRPMPNLDAGAAANEECYYLIGERELYPDFLAQRSDEWGVGDVHACEYCCVDGQMSSTSWEAEADEEFEVDWEGMEGCKAGDIIGLLLNLDEGKLTAYRNNRLLGVMKDGLSGSYCWYVSVSAGKAISIKRGEPPVAREAAF